MNVRWITAAAMCAVALAPAVAGEGSLKVYATDEVVEVGQVFTIVVEVEGRKIGDVRMPQVSQLYIEPRPSLQRSLFSAVLGQGQKFTQVQGFNARALQEGDVTIPPLTVEIDGKPVSSKPVVVRVVPAGAEGPPLPPAATGPEEDNVTHLSVEDVAFLRTEVDKTEVYVGEPVSLTMSFYRLDESAVRVSTPEGGIELTFPETEGFYSIPERPEELDGLYAEFEGRRYRGARWRQTLFATSPGDLVVPPWEWNAAVYAHTVRGPVSARLDLHADPIPITVKPLPKRPLKFNGAVGQFTFQAQVTPRNTTQNVPVTLIIRVNGTGNPAAIAEPKLPALEGAHVSEPERAVQPIMDPEGVTAETTFSYQVTPVKAGALAIPPVEFCYFDPVKEAFVTEKSPAFIVNVAASGENGRRLVAGASIAPEPERADGAQYGLLPIVTAVNQLRRGPSSRAGAVTVLLFPPLAYGALTLWTARQRRFAQDHSFARAYRAKSRMRKRLRHVLDAGDRADALYRAINGYIADKFDLPEAGMTSTDVRDLFEGRAITQDAAARLLDILRTCERARYAGETLSREAVEPLLDSARESMEQLDQWLRKESR
ncbi:MAG TPA: BatD family protein [Candidatus Hydrogenedentes bacterium]|nr:BatD family protein [FCB group bacterium]HNV22411.1 BatD family protein [Candidatus Hydrogenedentota bacterium]HQM32223.1 BatD family protein [Candidatus Hydrogenedentota bacterium]